MTTTANRLVFTDKCQLRMEEVELPEIGPSQFLVENEYSVISPGTELAVYLKTHMNFSDPSAPQITYPYNPGYASVGRVLAKGSQVTEVAVGDRVAHIQPHATKSIVDISVPNPLHVKLDPGCDGPRACFFIFGVVSITSVFMAHVPPENVLVLGGGIIGNFAAQLFRLHGARRVMLSDINPFRLDIARRCGIEHVINSATSNLAESVKAATHGEGANLIVEATGIPALIPAALDLVNPRGEVILLGSTRGFVELNVYKLIHVKGVTLTGAHLQTYPVSPEPGAPHSRFESARLCSDWIARDQLLCGPCITHVISPAQFAEAYDGLANKQQEYLGVIVDWKRTS